MTFEQFALSLEMNQALAKMQFTEPSPIQVEAIPPVMAGKDIIGQARTGTGKTAAFAIPLIEKVDIADPAVQSVVVCPTRELAMQVADEFRKLAKFKQGLFIVCVYGGQPMDRQLLALGKRPQIIIGTPGRMLDHLWRGSFHLNAVKTVVLDEADEMLNMGFREEIEKIFDFIPEPRQTVFFSATMPKPILELTQKYQQNPEWIRIAPEPAETLQIQQSYVEVSQRAKAQALTRLISQHQLGQSLVFCNTRHHVDAVVRHLKESGFAVEGLHGGKAQHQRERIMTRFRKGTTQLLVATDVAARGIDVRDIHAVINYDLPEDEESYTHRIGRTGRAGRSGQAFSLVAGHQAGVLRRLQKSHNNRICRETLTDLTQLQNSQDAVARQKHQPRRKFNARKAQRGKQHAL